MTDADLARWEALCAAATPGPWRAEKMAHCGRSIGIGYVLGPNDDEIFDRASNADCDFIAEVRRLQARVDDLQGDPFHRGEA